MRRRAITVVVITLIAIGGVAGVAWAAHSFQKSGHELDRILAETRAKLEDERSRATTPMSARPDRSVPLPSKTMSD